MAPSKNFKAFATWCVVTVLMISTCFAQGPSPDDVPPEPPQDVLAGGVEEAGPPWFANGHWLPYDTGIAGGEAGDPWLGPVYADGGGDPTGDGGPGVPVEDGPGWLPGGPEIPVEDGPGWNGDGPGGIPTEDGGPGGQDGGGGEAVPGGPNSADPEDPTIKTLACWAVGQLDVNSNSIYQQRPIRIISAFQQIVAGVLYHLRMTVGLTVCPKGQNCDEPLELLDCAMVNHDGKNPPKVCDIEIWDVPWLNQKTVTNSTCKEISFADLDTVT